MTETYFALNLFLRVKVVPSHIMKTYRVSRGIGPFLLILAVDLCGLMPWLLY